MKIGPFCKWAFFTKWAVTTACLAPQAENFEISSILIEKIPTILQKIEAPIMLRYA